MILSAHLVRQICKLQDEVSGRTHHHNRNLHQNPNDDMTRHTNAPPPSFVYRSKATKIITVSLTSEQVLLNDVVEVQ